VQHRSSLSASTYPLPGQIHFDFSRRHPCHRYATVSECCLDTILGLHAPGHTPHHDVSTMMQRSFSDSAAPPARYVPRGANRIQPSYCFHGATATHRFSDPLRPHSVGKTILTTMCVSAWSLLSVCVASAIPSRACDTRLGIGVRARPWSFVTRYC
jgi:hypothetical protein